MEKTTAKTQSSITEEITAAMQEQAPLDWTKAQALAERFGVKARAIVASATRQGIAYEKKKRVSKTGQPVVSKTDLVGKIASRLDLTTAQLEGLDKATKSVLELLVSRMGA